MGAEILTNKSTADNNQEQKPLKVAFPQKNCLAFSSASKSKSEHLKGGYDEVNIQRAINLKQST